MIFEAGERVSFLPMVSEHPETAVFQLTDERGEAVILPLTVANGGLVPRLKGALHPVFTAPTVPGRYSYRFWDVEQVSSGMIRVTAASPPPAPAEPEPAASAYTGAGARRAARRRAQ